MPWSRRKAITDITFVTLSQYLTQFILILRGFIFAKFLGPEQFGVYSAIFLFYTYGVYAQLGILDGLWRLVPYFLAQGDEAKG
jgi:O-antigen/teichoic acid export membrane protein